MRSLLTLLLFTLTLSAADITGAWKGSVEFKRPDGSPGGGEVYATFKQAGDKVTGSIGEQEEDQKVIDNGKLDGNVLTFTVAVHDGQQIFKLKLTLVSDNEFNGEVHGTNPQGEKIDGKIKLTRKTA